MIAPPRALALLLALSAASACNTGKSKEREEAERIIAAIERLGTLPAAEREPHIAALENAKVESPRVDALRIHCARAYRALHTAQSSFGSMTAGDPLAMADELARANKALDAAKLEHDECTKSLAEVRKALDAK